MEVEANSVKTEPFPKKFIFFFQSFNAPKSSRDFILKAQSACWLKFFYKLLVLKLLFTVQLISFTSPSTPPNQTPKNNNREEQYLNLLHIMQNTPLTSKKSIGIIIDATRPYKNEDIQNYTVRLKIIDDSLNYEALINNNQKKKYVHIFLDTKWKNLCPKSLSIGDIIVLH